MDNSLTSSTTTTGHSGNKDGAAEVLTHPVGIGEHDGPAAQAGRAYPHLTLVRPAVWRHRLILTGSLDQSTAIELEEEVECLCEEGVAALTLDLCRLEGIDSFGARTIAFGVGAVCRRRGCDLAVLGGSPVVRHALAEVGAESLLAVDRGKAATVALAARTAESSRREMSTAMIKDL